MQPRLAHWVHAAARGRRGIASVEFAVIVAVITVIVLSTYDISSFVLQQMKVADAAHVGGQYAVSYPLDSAGMRCAVEGVFCPGVGYSSLGGGCTGAACPLPDITITGPTFSGSQVFVTITVTKPYTPFLIGSLTSTSASYVARIK
jgi:Flp pilus assembly pilin Flp